ncbi:MAG: hypothetical protein ACRC2H_05275 [Silanimonas sp.]
MRRYATAVLLLFAVTLAACSDAPAPAAPEPLVTPSPVSDAPVDAPPPAAPIETPSLETLPFAATLAAGTPYADARAAVQAAGWRPIITDACAENVGGEATVCRELPELEACSGTGAGYCLMAFGSPDASQTLSLRTSGGHDGWAATGDAATVRLDRAELAVVEVSTEQTCGSSDFLTFLETFAADPTVRAAWTAPLVRVTLRYDLGEDSVEVAGLQHAADFRGFPVTHEGEAFHYVDANGAVDMAPLALRVTEPDADTRDVAFDYGLSEGNRVRFVRSGECWQLTEDPDPPSP